ncbi:ABC transporter ATP-binding protein [Fusibacter paucivorans]|uniref:ABC transporter ATP-binding protein n=1 Tax=Fusibacter paucivorans TaxID=76009 RepID=A0ABS5PLU0_9FIRM|nr:ABC transporter ATP-binding protein [Fusibacter paucivorans]MBS7526135.1 ABC transporter ATP-binding protein [Fusibacter paucivorans]
MKDIFSYLGDYRNKMKMSILSILASVFLGIVPYFIVYIIIESIIGADQKAITDYLILALLAGGALFIKEYLYMAGIDLSHECAFNVLKEMRKALAYKIERMPLGSIHDKGIGTYKKLFADDIDALESVLAHTFPEGIPYAAQTFVVLLVLLIIDWRMGMLVLAAIPLGMIPMVIMVIKTKDKMKIFYRAEKAMNRSIIEYIEGMEVIKAFNRVSSSYQKYETAIMDYKHTALEMYKISWKYNALMATFLPTTILLALPFGVKFVIGGTLNLSTLILCLMLAMSVGPSLMKLTEFMSSISIINNKSVEFLNAMREAELETVETGKLPDFYDITFENVSFGYDETYVLKNINLKAKANQVTAIVGKSGSGKSTLAKLLVRFWQINSGKISIGNVDIDEISQNDLMCLISYVSQEAFLFDIPIIDNIRLGKPDASDEAVEKAAIAAGCHDFIMTTKNGYQTCPGNSGDKLSGGEKQRITIARAILKNAPIVILDEATSSTDPENEDQIQEAVNALIKDKTLIVIAHRLSTIAEANNIIVVDDGEVLMSGNHETLIKSESLYKTLWDAHTKSMQWDIKGTEGQLC